MGEMMINDYEKGYQAGYEACIQLYKKRDYTLLKTKHVYEHSYIIRRPDFMTNFNPTDRELKAYIDNQTFKKNVKSARNSIEILQLGDWYLIYETGLIFEMNDDVSELSLEERFIEYIINFYKKEFFNSKK